MFCYFINEGFIPRGKLHFKTRFISYKHIFRVIYDSTCLGGTKFAANHLFTHVLNSYYSMFKDYWNCISTYVVFIDRIPLYFTFLSFIKNLSNEAIYKPVFSAGIRFHYLYLDSVKSSVSNLFKNVPFPASFSFIFVFSNKHNFYSK